MNVYGTLGLALAISLVACTGPSALSAKGKAPGDGSDQGPARSRYGADSDENAQCLPEGPFRSRRLTSYEFLGTLRQVFGDPLMTRPSVAAAVGAIHEESVGDITQDFQDAYAFQEVDGRFQVSDAIVSEVEKDPALQRLIFGDCAAAGHSDVTSRRATGTACAERYLDSVAVRLMGRPLDTERRAAWLQGFERVGGGVTGLLSLLSRTLQSPFLSFHFWSGADARSLASMLSYSITGSAPDEELVRAAESESFGNRDALTNHAMRLGRTDFARERFRRLVESWLDLNTHPDANNIVARHHGLEAAKISEEAYRELLDFALYAVFDANARAADLLTLPVGFPRSARLAGLYGSEVAGTLPVSLPNGHRGLLLRIAPLISGNLHTSPILRGAYIRNRLLCGTIPSASAAVVDAGKMQAEALDRSRLSNRAVTDEVTMVPGCSMCHASINPFGYALETFDALGQPRTTEEVLGQDGRVIANHKIETSITNVSIDGRAISTIADAQELNSTLAQSRAFHLCVSKRLVVDTQLRALNTTSESEKCFVNRMADKLLEGMPVFDAWIDVAVSSVLARANAK